MDSKSYSKGICWIDDCRIPFVNKKDIPNDMDKSHLQEDRLWNGVKGLKPFLYHQNNQGRFPANILVSDDMLNDGIISKSDGGKGKIQEASFKYDKWNKYYSIGDKGTNSRYYDIDKWFDKIIDD